MSKVIIIDELMKSEAEQLNSDQQAAVTHWGSPLLVLAGAGSGKTKVLTHRVAWLTKERGVDPSKIVLLTFTNKAAAQMKEKVLVMSEGVSRIGFAGTFHTFGAKMIREFGRAVGLSPDFLIYDSADSEDLIKQVIKDMGLDISEHKPKMYLSVISKMKNDLADAESIEKKDYFHKQVATIWREYQKRLQQYNAADFDDLLVKTVNLLSIDRVRSEINARFEYILVDEYQDTNKAQFALTKLLTGSGENITAVGDASQAIYSFRGADFRNLSLLSENYPNLTTVSLPRNYRSTQKILDAAWGVIRNNTGHPVIKLDADRGGDDKVELIEAEDERDEARIVVNKARLLIGLDEEVAILYRTNAQSRAFEDELMKRDLAYRLVGGLRFYSRAEVKDVLAYVRLVINPKDEISRKRVEKIGKRRAEKFWTYIEGRVVEKQGTKPDQLMEEIIEATKYIELYDEKDEDDRSRIENINELLAVAGEYETARNFLESAALSEAEEKKSSKNAKIVLTTVHAAKGLEFDNVFVVGMEEGMFPHSRASFNKEELEEERRLAYVAITRAKKRLFLSFARNRLVFGGRNATYPSRFLAEIPENLYDKASNSGRQKEMAVSKDSRDEFGEKRRIIVPDWELELETKNDFDEIDNW